MTPRSSLTATHCPLLRASQQLPSAPSGSRAFHMRLRRVDFKKHATGPEMQQAMQTIRANGGTIIKLWPATNWRVVYE